MKPLSLKTFNSPFGSFCFAFYFCHLLVTAMSLETVRKIAEFLDFGTLPLPPMVPAYVGQIVVRQRTAAGYQFVVRNRSQRLLAATHIVLQCDIDKLKW